MTSIRLIPPLVGFLLGIKNIWRRGAHKQYDDND